MHIPRPVTIKLTELERALVEALLKKLANEYRLRNIECLEQTARELAERFADQQKQTAGSV